MSEQEYIGEFAATGNALIDRILQAVANLEPHMCPFCSYDEAILDDIQTQANIAAEFYAVNYGRVRDELSRLLAERQAEMLDG